MHDIAPASAPLINSRESFLLHVRPRYYDSSAIRFQNTWLLGFFSVFFLVVECVTGAVLMVYYVPTPADAYGSIMRLTTEIPFGWLVRDLHRLAGEGMILAVSLHMLRVLLAGAYHDKRRPTWVTGMLLWLCTLVLAFSGYLLPWDQLAYWAITIGTSIIDTIPGIGHQLTQILRGGPIFGLDGLLRFYLLHIVGVPVMLSILLAIHYYRVARLHGISVPAEKRAEPFSRPDNEPARLPFFPTIPLYELCLSLLALITMIVVVTFFYDAPLQHHADPRHTPAATRAPWFFLWLQGGLKLGDSFVMGICFPLVLFLLVLFLPYIDRSSPRQSLRNRPFFSATLLTAFMGLLLLTYLGLPRYGIQLNPVSVIFTTLAPEESDSRFHDIGYFNLPHGIYTTDRQTSEQLPVSFRELLAEFTKTVNALPLSEGYREPQGVIIIEDWQADLKRITLRIHWLDTTVTHQPTSSQTYVYLHRRENELPVVRQVKS